MAGFGYEMRAMFEKIDDSRDAERVEPENLIKYRDIAYDNKDEVFELMDVYIPDTGKEKYPVIIDVHGGGWVYGDKNRYRFFCMDMALRGFAVVNFSYRLAPENKFPSALEDLNSVIHWIMENGKDYQFDMDHIFFLGDSAGANISALYCNFLTNQKYQDSFDFKPPKGFFPTANVLECGSYNPFYSDNAKNAEMDKNLMEDILPGGWNDPKRDLMNVIAFINSDFPQSMIVTATHDFIRSQSLMFVNKLAELNIPFQFNFYAVKGQEVGHVFHLDYDTPLARKCNDTIAAYLKQFI